MSLLWVRQEWNENLNDGTSPNVETEYQVVTNDMDYPILTARLDLLAQLVADGAMVFGNLPLSDIKIERLQASSCFRARCTYGMRQLPEDGKFDFTMDSRPESKRVFVALNGVVATYPAPGRVAPDDRGLLNVSSDLVPTGTDLYVPVKTYNVSVWWSANRFNLSQPLAIYQSLQNYLNLIDTLEGCVNSTYFSFTARGLTFGFQPGECLFSGSRLSQQAADLWQIDIELRKKKNYIDPLLTLYNGSDVIVQGWDEVDVLTEAGTDASSSKMTAFPYAAKIKRTYFRDDLNKLHVPSP